MLTSRVVARLDDVGFRSYVHRRRVDYATTRWVLLGAVQAGAIGGSVDTWFSLSRVPPRNDVTRTNAA